MSTPLPPPEGYESWLDWCADNPLTLVRARDGRVVPSKDIAHAARAELAELREKAKKWDLVADSIKAQFEEMGK